MSNRWMKRADEMAQYGFGPKAMVSIKVCAECGKQVSATEVCCPSCGESLNKQTLLLIYQQMHPFCPACGTVAPDEASYCPVCGAKLAVKDKATIPNETKTASY